MSCSYLFTALFNQSNHCLKTLLLLLQSLNVCTDIAKSQEPASNHFQTFSDHLQTISKPSHIFPLSHLREARLDIFLCLRAFLGSLALDQWQLRALGVLAHQKRSCVNIVSYYSNIKIHIVYIYIVKY